MVHALAAHRADHAQVVGAGTYMREQRAYRNTALSIVLIFPERFYERSWLGVGEGQRTLDGKRLAVIPVQALLGIEGVDMRDASVHEQKNSAFGLGCEMRNLGRQRIDCGIRIGRR